MAEITFKSAGVKTREIDLSQPTRTGPVGVPAGIIGTSLEGPAYVPLTFANYSDFVTTFGASDGKKFGPIAVNQWLSNAQSVTYMRVLGAGDGKQRNATTGKVNNAGFTVGNRTIQENGVLANNKFANSGPGTGGAPEGRTYFLGCFMSESNGSTIFSDAGIQVTSGLATKECIELAGFSNDDHVGITVPVSAGGTGVEFKFKIHSGDSDGSTTADTNQLGIGIQGGVTAAAVAAQIAAFINAGTDGTNTTNPTGGVSYTNGVAGLNASVTNSTRLTLSAAGIGAQGNLIVIRNINGNVATATALEGGSGGAVPILRGVLLAPSGVILHLSGNNSATTSAPLKTDTASSADAVIMGRTGGLTGSLDLATQEFVMLMNGYKNADVNKKTHITASFDMTAPNYFAKVFNTDPFKTEEEGHLLYGHYDIYPDLAAVTGSGAITAGIYSKGIAGSNKEDIALLLTSSLSRNVGSSTVPNYEDFEDRFSHAKTPFVISQGFSGVPKNLFRIHLLSAGEGVAKKYKFSIENIRKSSDTANKYGTFDLLVRSFDDTDEELKTLESFRGLSLDPTSDRYIGRVVGDQHIFYNFDVAESSQKIIVDGSHPVRSRFIRVEMADNVASGDEEAEALPFGFRGPNHLVTSGSVLANESDASVYTVSSIVQSIVEPPIPYRNTISIGTGITKRSDARFFWGINTVRQTSATQPNLVNLPDESFNTYLKHFPTHHPSNPNFSVGNNNGAANVNGSVLDSDLFNKNKFSLENILVRTGSDTKADPEQWLSASYKRGGASENAAAKTRGFKVDDLDKVANIKFAKFTFVAQGGFNGTDIFDEEKYKLSNTAVLREVNFDENSASTDNNTVASFRKATSIMSSKADVDIQVLAIPGIRHASVTDFAIRKVEDRFDAIYIMDIEERDQLNTVITSSVQKPHVSNTVTSFKNRALDNSFAAAYFPDVVVTDPDTRTLVQVPPSVAVLGAYSLNDRVAHPWFAPAGFTRGALDTVEMASVRLNRANLDDLYEADINPIAEFPGVGITIWGQKTLQAANSALDRINVRRLLIDVRRKVRNVANSLLFEPNRSETLERFTALVNPILQRVQEQSGIDRFKAVIDTSTTTQADVENNTIRGKIFLQPTRSVEFVALDFVVTNAGSNI